jgi:hypothetical protein
VGKSTFINAFINYINFSTLDDAMLDVELNCVILCSFAIQYKDESSPQGHHTQKEIKVGHKDDEHDSTSSKSAT